MRTYELAIRKRCVVKVCTSEDAVREVEILKSGTFATYIGEVGMLMGDPFKDALNVRFAVPFGIVLGHLIGHHACLVAGFAVMIARSSSIVSHGDRA